jgi:hypothetical protein
MKIILKLEKSVLMTGWEAFLFLEVNHIVATRQ